MRCKQINRSEWKASKKFLLELTTHKTNECVFHPCSAGCAVIISVCRFLRHGQCLACTVEGEYFINPDIDLEERQ